MTAQQYQNLIAAEVGQDGNQKLLSVIAAYWDKNDGGVGGVGGDKLRHLRTRRDTIIFAMGQVWQQAIDRKEGDTELEFKTLTANLTALLKTTEAQIAEIITESYGGGVPITRELVRQAPIEPRNGWEPDPNDPYYRGAARVGRPFRPIPLVTEE